MGIHLKLYGIQLKQLNQKQRHPLYDFNASFSNPEKNIKSTIFITKHPNIIISHLNITPKKF